MHALETSGLTYRFTAAETVLRDVALAVPRGSIYGFLGPNGAGKTTTLRLLLGLLRLQEGTIRVFDEPLDADRVATLRRIGSSIESPSLYGHLTAAENLEVWRRLFQCPAASVPDALALVGLSDTAAKRADQFSLGMRQRLSIAVAVLHQPSLLILDEPTNGLDPHGILEVRGLLTRLNQERGMTIVVSSHILAEIEKLVTHVGIIHRGTLMFQGTLGDLVARQQEASFTQVKTSDNDAAAALLSRAGWLARVDRGKVILPSMTPHDAGRVNAALMIGGLSVYEITTVRKDLESIFLDMIGAA